MCDGKKCCSQDKLYRRNPSRCFLFFILFYYYRVTPHKTWLIQAKSSGKDSYIAIFEWVTNKIIRQTWRTVCWPQQSYFKIANGVYEFYFSKTAINFIIKITVVIHICLDLSKKHKAIPYNIFGFLLARQQPWKFIEMSCYCEI